MKFLLNLSFILIFLGCSTHSNEDEVICIEQVTDTIYIHQIDTFKQTIIDTLYIEDAKTYPWEFSCVDTACSQADMTICSLECFKGATRIKDSLYQHLLLLYEQKKNNADAQLLEFYQSQQSNLKLIDSCFNAIQNAYGNYVYAFYNGGTMAPMVYYWAKTSVITDEFEMLLAALFEANH